MFFDNKARHRFSGSFPPEATDTQILQLRDLFAAYPNVPMNIDIKVDDDELIMKVSRELSVL